MEGHGGWSPQRALGRLGLVVHFRHSHANISEMRDDGQLLS